MAENPVLLTSPSGDLLEGKDVSHHTMRRFKSILSQHQLVPRSLVYLADGYDIERYKFVVFIPHASVWDENHISLDIYLEKNI